jgi:DNA polymerase III alpha subunit (gram-positive type)
MTQQRCHIAIDLETLSTSPAAVVLAIGAVAVCETTGETVSFYTVCSVDSQESRQIDQSTLHWWEQQSAEARLVLDQANDPTIAIHLDDALAELSAWVGKLGETHEVFVWGNGANFDVAILEHAYKNISPFVPWAFRNVRDMRTLRDIALRLGLGPQIENSTVRTGTHHNALDDAQFQANVVMASLKVINSLTEGTPA